MKHTTQQRKMNEGWAIDTASRSKTHYYKNGISLCGKEKEKNYFRNFETGIGSIYLQHCAICVRRVKQLIEHIK